MRLAKGIIFGIIAVTIGLGIASTVYNHNSVEIITITVDSKDQIMVGSGETMTSQYMIYSQTEVFENTDAMTFGKMNSHDVQARLKVGETYTVKVCGFRNLYLSSTRNILEIIK